MQRIPTSTPPRLGSRRRVTWRLATALAAITLVALGVGIMVFRGNDASTTASTSGQQLASAHLASVQQSCQAWTGSSTPALATNSPSASWCTSLTGWMGQQLSNGHTTGAMMWGSAATLQNTCEQWMASGSHSTGNGAASPGWCGEMVGSMAQRVGNWGDWMGNANMMGR